MANITNLSQFLSDVADAIRTKKDSSAAIPAAEFDNEILNIETGINTSDATATEDNIENGYTAYVDGKKVSGTIVTSLDTIITAGSDATITDTGTALNVDRGYGEKIVLKSEQQLRSTIPYNTLANIAGLTPEKLIKGETVLGVEGTAEGSGEISGEGAKLFATTDEMHADETAKENDVAVIYGMQCTNVAPGVKFTRMYLPETIVLPRAVTVDIGVELSMGGSGSFPTITSTGFSLYGYVDSTDLSVRYTSSDGITYTREYVSLDSWDDSDTSLVWDADTEILSYTGTYYDGWTYTIDSTEDTNPKEILSVVFREARFAYDGLYKYTGTTDSNYTTSVQILGINKNGSTSPYDWTPNCIYKYDNPYAPIKTVVDLCLAKNNDFTYLTIEQISDTMFRVYAYHYLASNGNVYVNGNAPFAYMEPLTGETGLRFSYSVDTDATYPISNHYFVIYDVNLNTNTVTDVSSTVSKYSKQLPGDSTRTIYYLDPIDPTHQIYRHYYNRNENNTISICVPTETTAYTYTNLDMELPIGKKFAYTPAETQFTLESPNELLTGRVALGANGAVVGDGSIYSNLDGQSVATDILGMDIGATNYLAKAADNKLSYLKFNSSGNTSLVKTNYFKYLEYYTKYKANTYSTAYYGFTYLTDDGKTYVYMSTDNKIVFIDTETEETTSYSILKASQWYSISLEECTEKLFYVSSANKLCIFDCVTKEIITTSFSASSLYSISVQGDSKYSFVGIYLSSSNHYIIAIDNETNSIITQINTSALCYVHKTPSTYYITTQSTNKLYKFTGTSFTQLRSGGFSIGLQSSGFAFEDSSILYCPYRSYNQVVKVYKTGSSANGEATVTSNNELSMIPVSTLPLSDGKYLVAGKTSGGEYFYCKCNVSVKNGTLHFEEIDATNRWEIPYYMKWYDDINSELRTLTGLPNYLSTKYNEQEDTLRICRNDSSTSGSYPDSCNSTIIRASIESNADYDVCGIRDYRCVDSTNSYESYFLGYHLFKEQFSEKKAIETASEILGEEEVK